jgi:hypothetical protein
MACSSCRRAPIWRQPTSTGNTSGSKVVARPAVVNNNMVHASTTGDSRSRITGLKYAPR